MSAQVVVAPTTSRVASTKSIPAVVPNPRSAAIAAKLNRFRQPPPKPEIQVDKSELKKKLTPLQYRVTQEKFTERPYSGEYLKLNERGKYCCIVCDEELFSSETKFDSGCGWPAFYNVIDNKKVIVQADLSHIGGNLLLLALNQDLARTEVTCAKCGAHLGHVFEDGPKPTGKRYCVNSASLRFHHQQQQQQQQQQQNEPICDCDDPPKKNDCDGLKSCLTSTANKQTSHQNSPVKSTTVGSQQQQQRSDNLSSRTVNSDQKNKSPVRSTTANESLDGKKHTKPTQNTLLKLGESGNGAATTVATQGSIKPATTTFSLRFSAPFRSDITSVAGKSDANNNRITPNKYSLVKSRYLNHLSSESKKSAVDSTAKKQPVSSNSGKPLLETHL